MLGLWNRFLVWVGVYPKSLRIVYLDDLPDTFEKATAYIVGENGHYWCIAMLCPCGCHQIIQLNLLPYVKPRWSFHERNSIITIHPSIWRNSGCRSHFYVHNGRVIWCRESVNLPVANPPDLC